jgi:putative DNA methylase
MMYRKKLIEVSLPLEAINKEAAREKSIRHGHPSTLHLWWARRPLAACRAVLFSSLVDDPSEYMADDESARLERERLFAIIEDLVKWENSNNEEVLDKAKLEIARSLARTLDIDMPVGREAIREFLATQAPPVLDPFAGGGSIPLEAQRLGLRAYASDLNPVAVLINKALIEIPPKFANLPPVHPADGELLLSENGKKSSGKKKETQPTLFTREWKGAQGLAEDVRYYGKWMRNEAYKRIGHCYPPVTITKEILAERPDLQEQGLKAGNQLTTIAWLWARTVTCPNPACGAQMPLIRSFELYTKKGKQSYLEPYINRNTKPAIINFDIRTGDRKPLSPPKTGRGAHFKCLACEQVVPDEHLKSEGKSGRMKTQLLAIVAESKNGRVYLPSNEYQILTANSVFVDWRPDLPLSPDTRAIWCPLYGLDTFDKLFTPRQLHTLNCLTELIEEVRKMIILDVSQSLLNVNANQYSDAIVTYLAEGVSKFATFTNITAQG